MASGQHFVMGGLLRRANSTQTVGFAAIGWPTDDTLSAARGHVRRRQAGMSPVGRIVARRAKIVLDRPVSPAISIRWEMREIGRLAVIYLFFQWFGL